MQPHNHFEGRLQESVLHSGFFLGGGGCINTFQSLEIQCRMNQESLTVLCTGHNGMLLSLKVQRELNVLVVTLRFLNGLGPSCLRTSSLM